MTSFSPISCVLLDDVAEELQQLKIYASQTPALKVVTAVDNVSEAFPLLASGDIDLLISDIDMPMLDGLGFVRTLPKSPLVVFQTAYPQYAVDSYQVDAVDFLVKPYSFERFLQAIRRVQQQHTLLKNAAQPQEDDFFFIREDKVFTKLYTNDVLYFEAAENYCGVVTDTQRYMIHIPMRRVEEQLPSIFQRVSRSHVANLKHVKQITKTDLILSNGEKIALSDTWRQAIEKLWVQSRLLVR